MIMAYLIASRKRGPTYLTHYSKNSCYVQKVIYSHFWCFFFGRNNYRLGWVELYRNQRRIFQKSTFWKKLNLWHSVIFLPFQTQALDMQWWHTLDSFLKVDVVDKTLPSFFRDGCNVCSQRTARLIRKESLSLLASLVYFYSLLSSIVK